ncbi:MAG: DJ-1/PfpI family protein [Planctomycetota bacterium]|nr:DJ-1/PfpI family protein [Planctomycetota bacterium]
MVIPGGYSPDHLRRCKQTVDFVRDIFDQGKLVAAICHGGWVLVSANIAKGIRGTSYISIKDDLTNAGMDWSDEEVVVDGNVVTSRYPDDLPAFMRTIIEKLV